MADTFQDGVDSRMATINLILNILEKPPGPSSALNAMYDEPDLRDIINRLKRFREGGERVVALTEPKLPTASMIIWREKLICRILLLIAWMFAEGDVKVELKSLSNHIAYN